MAKKYQFDEDEMAAVVEGVVEDTYDLMQDKIAACWAMHKALRIVTCVANWDAFLEARAHAVRALEQARVAGIQSNTSDDELVLTLRADTTYAN